MFLKMRSVSLLAAACSLFLGWGGCSDDSAGGENTNINSNLDCEPIGSPCTDNPDCCSEICDQEICVGPDGTCLGLNEPCLNPSECCSGRCEEGPGGEVVCALGGCAAAQEACDVHADCCSLFCENGTCSYDELCTIETGECTEDWECCSGDCPDGTCANSGSFCIVAGELCGGNTGCCSGLCEDVGGEMRCTILSACRSSGEVCTDGADCCSGVCGDDGLCPRMDQCQTVGEVCTGYHECCSGLCADPGTGVTVCQYFNGCRPINEVCLEDGNCCSNICDEFMDTGVWRCVDPGGCLAEGEICFSGVKANCCPEGPTGGPALCMPTNLGVNRCYPEGWVDECIEDGESCSFSDECCGGFCLPDENGDLVCTAACIPIGEGVCTADSDCCDGGVCGPGGVCTPNTAPCIPLGGYCDAPADCCSIYCENHVCIPMP